MIAENFICFRFAPTLIMAFKYGFPHVTKHALTFSCILKAKHVLTLGAHAIACNLRIPFSFVFYGRLMIFQYIVAILLVFALVRILEVQVGSNLLSKL